MIIRDLFASLCLLACFCITLSAQLPMNVQMQIVKAEDARRYDKTLEDLMRSPNADVRKRAALAAGRIGREEAIPSLVHLLESDPNTDVRTMAAFALGETESIKAADAVLSALSRAEASATQAETRVVPSVSGSQRSGSLPSGQVSARLVEAAGKIAAANPKDPKSKQLGAAVLKLLEAQQKAGPAQDAEMIRLGLAAVLRARPDGAAEVVRPFLAYSDPNIVADALNTLARLRAKNANRDARDLLATNLHAVVRANAARVLGAAEDKEAVEVLIKAATSDADQRVRVSAIRSLGALKDAKAVDPLIGQFRKLLSNYSVVKRKIKQRSEKNEILELETALGRLLTNSNDKKVVILLETFRKIDNNSSPETEIAFAHISPEKFIRSKPEDTYWLFPVPGSGIWPTAKFGSYAQGIAELSTREAGDDLRKQAVARLAEFTSLAANPDLGVKYPQAGEVKISKTYVMSQLPEVLRAYARFKPDDLESILREQLVSSDIFVRATAAELLAENFPTPGIRISIETAFKKALASDKQYDDAQLAMLDAMAKINKAAALDTIYLALDAPDYLVRKKALDLLDDPELLNKNPNVASVLTLAREKHSDEVMRYDPKTGTKLGQVLNTDADYRRALSRKNGTVRAVVTTEKGAFTIDLLPEDAPLTVDNFIKLARSKYFNGLEVHRVVPNFVMQDGDPRGDGNGGPGWSIRCEINMVPYERGAVGMALSGKDTGGSQWFVTHSPQPHLDGGYTIFGRVNETGMKVVDNIVRGDKIVSIRIVGK